VFFYLAETAGVISVWLLNSVMTIFCNTNKVSDNLSHVLVIFSPPGIAMSSAGLCFTDVTFFLMSLGRIATRIAELMPSMKKLLRLQIW